VVIAKTSSVRIFAISIAVLSSSCVAGTA